MWKHDNSPQNRDYSLDSKREAVTDWAVLGRQLMNSPSKFLALCGVAILTVSQSASAADPLISESFEYPLGDDLDLKNGGTGFKGSFSGDRSTVVEAMPFGGYGSGNANEIRAFGLTSRQLDDSLNFGGTLWTSFLMSKAPLGSEKAEAELRILGDAGGRIRWTLHSFAGNKFIDEETRVRLEFLWGGSSQAQAPEFPAISRETPYLFVTKVSNFSDENPTAPQQISLWVLDQNNYTSLSFASEAELDAHNVSKLVLNFDERRVFGGLNYLDVRNTGHIPSRTGGPLTFDELRMGTSLDSVLAVVPEVNALHLISLCLGGFALARRLKWGVRR